MIEVLGIIFAFGLVILFHEVGHFIVAKRSGVRVEKFSFGLGPEIVSISVGATKYCLCLIPIGGYVKLAGELLEESKGAQDEFFSQPWYRRICIAFAGPVMSYVLAFVLFFVVAYFWGLRSFINRPIIGEVIHGKIAEKVGLQPKDYIFMVDEKKVHLWTEVANTIRNSAGRKVKLHIRRLGKELIVDIQPEFDCKEGKWLIGISPVIYSRKPNILGSAKFSIEQIYTYTLVSVIYLYDKISHLSMPELAGPIGIAQMVSEAAKRGLDYFFNMVGVISALVAFANLLPIPMLDGGHIALYLFEGISRKQLNKNMFRVANMVGLSILIAIAIFATYSDLERTFYKFLPKIFP